MKYKEGDYRCEICDEKGNFGKDEIMKAHCLKLEINLCKKCLMNNYFDNMKL
jgi:hypothetical protein|tara:strand:+ start:551 stop:706 length:156 start_codon:yes stop_codon:yes gene_type:complete